MDRLISGSVYRDMAEAGRITGSCSLNVVEGEPDTELFRMQAKVWEYRSKPRNESIRLSRREIHGKLFCKGDLHAPRLRSSGFVSFFGGLG